MIAIVDYNVGNSGSIRNMLGHLGVASEITSKHEVIATAEKLILPGVGSFDTAMRSINALGLDSLLHEAVLKQRKPVLGVCLGMQLMTRCSEEGSRPGLGWIDGQTVKFRFCAETYRLRVPHMGWNVSKPLRDSPIWTEVPHPARFYFLHSYHVQCNNPADALCVTDYGFPFVSAFARDNIFGVQFHPEKSHKCGMALLKSFAQYA